MSWLWLWLTPNNSIERFLLGVMHELGLVWNSYLKRLRVNHVFKKKSAQTSKRLCYLVKSTSPYAYAVITNWHFQSVHLPGGAVLMCPDELHHLRRLVPFVARTGAVSLLRNAGALSSQAVTANRRECGVVLWSPPPPPPPLPRSSPDPYSRRITVQLQTGSWGHGGDWITGKNFRAEGALST